MLDLTERKRRRGRELREVQAELAHANRVATMGQLTASIAHEVKQPIAAARNNARAALNFWTGSRRTWARSGKRSAASWAMPIEPETSSTGSATTSRKRLRERIVLISMRRSMSDCIGARRNHQEWSLGPEPALRRGCFPFRGIVFNCNKSC